MWHWGNAYIIEDTESKCTQERTLSVHDYKKYYIMQRDYKKKDNPKRT